MIKHLLVNSNINPVTGNKIPVMVNGEKVKNPELIFDKSRSYLDPIQNLSRIEPLLIDYLKTEHTEDTSFKQLFDYMRWNKHEPIGYPFLVLSTELKNLIVNHKIQKHQLYETSLFFQNEIIEGYHILQFTDLPFLKCLDFSKTLFQDATPAMFYNGPTKLAIKVESEEELKETLEKNSWPDYEIVQLGLKNSFWENDLMFIRNTGIVVSEKIKESLIDSELTGFSFKNITFIKGKD